MSIALVTGGAGFIGSHLCDKLLSLGHKVVALDNLIVGTKKNLKKSLSSPHFKLRIGDVRDKRLVTEIVKEVDVIYHLAAIVGVSVVVKEPLENISINIDGVKNICKTAFDHGKKKVVFTSSSEVYGKNDSVPLNEESPSIFGSTKVSRWAYGMTKALGEQILWSYASLGLPVSAVRLFNCYGPRSANSSYANVIPKFIERALKNKPLPIYDGGKQVRCFCYVEDTVEGIIIASEKLSNDVVNIGSNNKIAVRQLAQKIIKLADSKSSLKFIASETVFGKHYEDADKRIPSISKAQKIGFSPQTSLREGLVKTIKWTKN